MLETEQFVVNMGPQHPSTHGGIHLEVTLDGEMIHNVDVHLGYDHRSIEKIVESRTYMQIIPYMSRLDYLSSTLPTIGYCQAVEKLMNIEIPERAEYMRVIMGELNRIASHLLFIGSLCIDLGATTGLSYCIFQREKIMKMLEMTSGQRMISAYMRIGGVSDDFPPEFYPAVNEFIDSIPDVMDEFENLISGNEIFQHRMKGIGVIGAEEAQALCLSGPSLRAAGVDFDIRKAEPYGVYDRFEFEVPTADYCDSWNRYRMRFLEILECAKIIRQALDNLPGGEAGGEFRAKIPRILKPEAGAEVYHRIEGAKGELGFYILSNGTEYPKRMHVRAPSFINLMTLPPIAKGGRVQDLITEIATLDPVLGEADR